MNECPKPHVLSALVDGECGPEERRFVHEHLQECPPCRRLVSEFSTVRRLVGGLERRGAPESLVRGALVRPRDMRELVRSALRGRRRYVALGAAAAAVVVSLGGLASPADQNEPPVDVFVARHASVSAGNHMAGQVIFAVTGR